MCDLCEAFHVWKMGSFFGLICKTCKVPMIVLIEHKSELTEKEREEVKRIVDELYPDKKLRGIRMRSNPDHWHEHVI